MSAATINSTEALSETRYLQRQTRARLTGMLQQTNETQEVGIATLDQLEQQRHQIAEIHRDTTRIRDKLKETEAMANRLDFWAMKWNNKRAAQAKARAELDRKLQTIEEHRKIQEQSPKSYTKETGAARRRKKQQKEQTSRPQNRTPLVAALDSNLDEETKKELLQMEHDDEEIDTMLHQLGTDVKRIQEMAKQMGEQVKYQEDELDDLEHNLDRAQEKQFVVSTRFHTYLNEKKWLRRNQPDKAPALPMMMY